MSQTGWEPVPCCVWPLINLWPWFQSLIAVAARPEGARKVVVRKGTEVGWGRQCERGR